MKLKLKSAVAWVLAPVLVAIVYGVFAWRALRIGMKSLRIVLNQH